MAGYIFFPPKLQYLDANGVPQPGSKLAFYEAGADTAAAVYEDVDLGTEASQPIVADAAGFFDYVFLDPDVSYKVKLTTAADAEIWTVDDYQIPNIGSSSQQTIYHEVSASRSGAIASGAEILYYEVGQPFTLPSGLESPDSQGECQTAPSGGAATFNITKNGTEIGTITFADGVSDEITAALAADTAFVAGDILKIEASATLNGVEDVTFTLLGSYGD